MYHKSEMMRQDNNEKIVDEFTQQLDTTQNLLFKKRLIPFRASSKSSLVRYLLSFTSNKAKTTYG